MGESWVGDSWVGESWVGESWVGESCVSESWAGSIVPEGMGLGDGLFTVLGLVKESSLGKGGVGSSWAFLKGLGVFSLSLGSMGGVVKGIGKDTFALVSHGVGVFFRGSWVRRCWSICRL